MMGLPPQTPPEGYHPSDSLLRFAAVYDACHSLNRWGCRPKPRPRDIIPRTPFFASRQKKMPDKETGDLDDMSPVSCF